MTPACRNFTGFLTVILALKRSAIDHSPFQTPHLLRGLVRRFFRGDLLQQFSYGPLFVLFPLICCILLSYLSHNEFRDLDTRKTHRRRFEMLRPHQNICRSLLLSFDSHRPQEVLVYNEQPHDIGGAGGHGVLLLLRDLGAEALKHEDVGRHDDGDVVEAHFVLGLVVDHTLEELQ